MRELRTASDLASACADDDVCVWAAQGFTGRAQAWAIGGDGSGPADAVAVASPVLARRDRLALWGEPDAVIQLAAQALALTGPSFRPLARGGLIPALCGRLPRVEPAATFGWMSAAPAGLKLAGIPAGPDDSYGAPRWLAETELASVTGFLTRESPGSYAWPGQPGVGRWAGIDGPDGALAAVAAQAWCAPAVGHLAGVAVRARSRGVRLAARVCGFVAADLATRCGRVTLMVDAGNTPAIRTYQRLGLRYSAIQAARVAGV